MTATQPETLTLDTIDAPIGAFLIATDERGTLRAVDFWADETSLRRLLRRHYGEVPIVVGRAPDAIRKDRGVRHSCDRSLPSRLKPVIATTPAARSSRARGVRPGTGS